MPTTTGAFVDVSPEVSPRNGLFVMRFWNRSAMTTLRCRRRWDSLEQLIGKLEEGPLIWPPAASPSETRRQVEIARRRGIDGWPRGFWGGQRHVAPRDVIVD